MPMQKNSMAIQPDFVDLASLFERRLFRIPEYQRAYSWRSRERQELYDDIEKTQRYADGRPHFMATIVGLRRDSVEIAATRHNVIEVVDGQQRITTLILLLKSIALKLDEKDVEQRRIARDLNELLVKDDNATLLLLQTNHDSSNYFADYIRNGTYPNPDVATTIADRHLITAMKECDSFVERWTNQGRTLAQLVSLTRNRMTFVFHEVAEESLVYTVFEVLNSRGLEVSWFDRLKSMLMAIVFESKTGNQTEHIDTIHNLWRQIYDRVGLRLGLSTESLRFAATLRTADEPSRPLGDEDAARLLQSQSQSGSSCVIDTSHWLLNVTSKLDELLSDKRMTAVMRIVQARLLATAILLRTDFTDRDRARVLRKWENVTFRIYGLLRKDARTAVGGYTRLAWDVTNHSLEPDQVIDRLTDIGRSYPLQEGLDVLGTKDCYSRWGEELRYLMNRYEEHLARSSGQKFNNEQWNRIWEASASSSIEHIRPQDWWKSRNRENDVDRMHGLGNLLILPPKLNSELQASAPKSKADGYIKTGLLVAREVAEQISSEGWTFEAMKNRKTKIAEWAEKEWGD